MRSTPKSTNLLSNKPEEPETIQLGMKQSSQLFLDSCLIYPEKLMKIHLPQ